MAIAKCANGHLYDSDQYASCPYCNQNQQVINFKNEGNWGGNVCPGGGVPVVDAGKTQPPPGYGVAPAGFPGTVKPEGFDDERRVTGDQKTMPPVNPFGHKEHRVTDEEVKTVGELSAKPGEDPVVGWLVCMKGKERGKDYRILAKKNSIGRLPGKCDICIKGDPQISRENHASIGYDPRKNRFHLIPGDSTNNIYLNGDAVYVPTLMKSYDLVEIGETALVFISFCSDRFDWENGLRETE